MAKVACRDATDDDWDIAQVRGKAFLLEPRLKGLGCWERLFKVETARTRCDLLHILEYCQTVDSAVLTKTADC